MMDSGQKARLCAGTKMKPKAQKASATAPRSGPKKTAKKKLSNLEKLVSKKKGKDAKVQG